MRQRLHNLVHRGGHIQATTYDPATDAGSIAISAAADVGRSGPAMNSSTGCHGLPKKKSTEETEAVLREKKEFE